MMLSMTLTAEIREVGQLAELVKQVLAGNEVVLTEGNKPVAKIVPTADKEASLGLEFNVPSFKGHRVLNPSPITQAEIAEEMFDH